MRTYKDILAGPDGTLKQSTRAPRSRDLPATVVVEGEEMTLALDTGLKRVESTAVAPAPMNRQNGHF